MAATENDDMASITQVNTSAMNHPNMSKFLKREMCKNYFVSEKKFNYSTELSCTIAEFQ